MTPLRACVIGAGEMGSNHVRALSHLGEVDLVGVADADADTLQRATHGRTVRGFADAGAMLRELTPDFTVVSVPTIAHEIVAVLALEAGSHVLVEKPIAADIASASRIKTVAEREGLLVTVGHIERFNPVIQQLRERLASGALGRVFQITARRTGPFPARVRDIGVIKDLATHDLDIIRHISGSPFEMVFAQSAQHLHEGHEDLASAQGRLANGTIVVLDVNWLTPEKVRDLRVLGEGGMYVADYVRQDLAFYSNGERGERFRPGAGTTGVVEGEVIHHRIDHKEPLVTELRTFMAAIREGAPAPVSIDDGMQALVLAEAVLQSAREQRPVSLDNDGSAGEAATS